MNGTDIDRFDRLLVIDDFQTVLQRMQTYSVLTHAESPFVHDEQIKMTRWTAAAAAAAT